jgi:hypothetical protein
MPNSLRQPTDSPVTSPGRSSRDVKQFAVTFACELVGHEVQFGWHEVVSGLDRPEAVPYAEQVVCSGIGMPHCAVQISPNGQAGWENCPRMRRLMLRLHNAVEFARDGAARKPVG